MFLIATVDTVSDLPLKATVIGWCQAEEFANPLLNELSHWLCRTKSHKTIKKEGNKQMHINTWMNTWMNIDKWIHTYIHNIHVYKCMYVCMNVCIHMYTCVYMYTYLPPYLPTYIHKQYSYNNANMHFLHVYMHSHTCIHKTVILTYIAKC